MCFSRVLASCLGSLRLPARKGRTAQGMRLTGPAGSRTAAPRGARPRPQTWPAPAHSHAARRRRGLPRDGGWDRAGVEPGCLSHLTWGVCFVLSRKRARSPMPRRGPLLRTRGHPGRAPVTPAAASASPAPHMSGFPEAQAQLLSHSPLRRLKRRPAATRDPEHVKGGPCHMLRWHFEYVGITAFKIMFPVSFYFLNCG